jgi:hypothetical protein
MFGLSGISVPAFGEVEITYPEASELLQRELGAKVTAELNVVR